MSTIIILGRSGAGKSTLAAGLSLATHLPIVEVGRHVIPEALLDGKPTDPVDHANRIFHNKEYFRFVARAASEVATTGAIIVGPRRMEEVVFLKHHFPAAVVIAVTASAGVRHDRRIFRDNGPVARYARRDAIEESWGIRRAMYYASIHLDGMREPQITLQAALGKLSHAVPKLAYCLKVNLDRCSAPESNC